MPQWVQKPANQVLIAGNPIYLEAEIGANATPAEMVAGRFVIHDTNDGDVKEAGAKALNVLGQLDVAPDKKESDAYAVGEQARLLTGVYEGKVTLLAGENVAPGDRLVTAANGKVAKLAVGALGAQGAVIAVALESSNVTVDAEIAALVDTLGGHNMATS
ncbi:MAG: hypothetical protein OEX10_06300 [Candidatus Bathyarchaeota archaeon]|nr:hypothetical protein [Candidatus Bathyarchaeota archaeon]